MFNKDDKKRLYWLMEQFLHNKIDGSTFCDEFYYSYDLEIGFEDLNELEKEQFSELSKTTSRFTQSISDIAKYPKVYSGIEQLTKAVKKAQTNLFKESSRQ